MPASCQTDSHLREIQDRKGITDGEESRVKGIPPPEGKKAEVYEPSNNAHPHAREGTKSTPSWGEDKSRGCKSHQRDPKSQNPNPPAR